MRSYLSGLLLGSLIWLFANSCASGIKYRIPEFPLVRYVQLESRTLDSAAILRNFEGQAPFMIASTLAWSYGPGDEEHAIGGGDPILKAEINFGDGSGWQDFTVDQKTRWYNPIAPSIHDPAWMTQHTYSVPGEYTITGRMTYWEGEVVYLGQGGEVNVKVLPASD